MTEKLCKTCGIRGTMIGHSECVFCWLTPKPGEPSRLAKYPDIEDESDDNPDPLDVCPYCGGPMTPNPYGMCSGCHRERQSYRDEWS